MFKSCAVQAKTDNLALMKAKPMRNHILALLLSISFVISGFTSVSLGKDNHAGYYYPEPQTTETYISALSKMATASKRSRIGFTVGLNARQLKRSYPPGYHLFAKGGQAEKLIIIATEEGRYNTLYRLRALLASLTSNARKSPLFSESGTPEELNFLDLCKLAGFTQVTISNGKGLTHQIYVV
jgi:hypothetical protein